MTKRWSLPLGGEGGGGGGGGEGFRSIVLKASRITELSNGTSWSSGQDASMVSWRP